jgi:hypothetical protein
LEVRAFSGTYCRVSEARNVESRGTSRKRVLFVRGGGWEKADVLQSFVSYVTGGDIAIVLSAANSQEEANQYLGYYTPLMSGATLHPIYTQSTADANRSTFASLSKMKGIFVPGGNPSRLRDLHQTWLGVAIKSAYEKGIPVYTNSASTALVGPYFGWNLWESLLPSLRLLPATFVSHLENPAKYQQSPSDPWKLVDNGHLEQSFGLTAGTLALVQDNEITLSGNGDPQNMMLVYDSKLPRTDHCHYWVLVPGESYTIR